MEISDSMAEKVLAVIENLISCNNDLVEALLRERIKFMHERKLNNRMSKLKELQKPFIPYDEDEDLGTEE